MNTPKKYQSSYNLISGAEYPGAPPSRTGLRVFGNQNDSHLTHSNDAILSSAPAFPGHRGIAIKRPPNQSSGVSASFGGPALPTSSRPISAHAARYEHSDGVALTLTGSVSARKEGVSRDSEPLSSARSNGIKTFSKGNSTSSDNPLSANMAPKPQDNSSKLNRGSVSSRGVFNSSQLFAALARQMDTDTLATSSFLTTVDASNVPESGTGVHRNARRAREQCAASYENQPEYPDELKSVSSRMDVGHLRGKRRDKLASGRGRKHTSVVCASSVKYNVLAPPEKPTEGGSTGEVTYQNRGKKHQAANPSFASSVNLGTQNTANNGTGIDGTPIQPRKHTKRDGAGAARCLDLSLVDVDISTKFEAEKVEKKKGIRCMSAPVTNGKETETFNTLANSTVDAHAFKLAFMNLGREEAPVTPVVVNTTRDAPFATTLSRTEDEIAEEAASKAGNPNNRAVRKILKRKAKNTSNTLSSTRSFNPITGEGDTTAALPACEGAGMSSRVASERVERWWNGKRENATTATTTTINASVPRSAGAGTGASGTGAALRTPRVGDKNQAIGFDAFAAAFAKAVDTKTF